MGKNRTNRKKRILKRHYEVLSPINATLREPIFVYGFIFSNGQRGTLKGYNRGLGPLDSELKSWEEPVGVYTDAGDYYYFVFDNRESNMRDYPTFSINGINYHYKIVRSYTMKNKVDPKTGNCIT